MVRAALRSAMMVSTSASTGNAEKEKLGTANDDDSYDIRRLIHSEEDENETENEFYSNMANKQRTKRKKRYLTYPKGHGSTVSPLHVHAHDWKAMIVISKQSSQDSHKHFLEGSGLVNALITTNFSLEPKLARVFRSGLKNAAKSTNAWIITSGLNEGVVKYVSAALEPVITPSKTKIVSIGIAPWGLVKRRDLLVGKNTNVIYHPQTFSKNNYAGLNERTSYYLLADNGTVGRYGAEIILRRKLESFLMEQRKIPVVCVLLEGGVEPLQSPLLYLSSFVMEVEELRT
uniref:TRPM SLOG domain-containing protein n=1 Tax=Acrobeloides nanus TaxID=290746 RepID=A0A914D1H6_9BILA